MTTQNLTDGFNLLVDALKLNDLTNIYAVAGIPITDVLRLAVEKEMKVIAFRHESNAGHAAAIAGYLTQKPGVCMTVSAPGMLNGMVALANATVNCFPMILISGSSDRAISELKRGDYEELDQVNAAAPYAKLSIRVNRVQDIGLALARAYRVAVSGRPGGVYVDIPGEVLAQTIDKEEGEKSLFKIVDPAPAQLPGKEAIDRAVDLLINAERPLVLLGKGAAYARAENEIRELVESNNVPFLPMSMAKGLIPDNHEQSAAAARSHTIGNADVVLLCGARLNWLLNNGQGPLWSDDTKFVHIDIEPMEMDSNRLIHAPLVGDIKSTVAALSEALKAKGGMKPTQEWLDSIKERKQKNFERMAKRLEADPTPMNFSSALRAVRDGLAGKPEVYLVNEGANTLDFARSIIDMYEPRKRLDTGTWGIMGIGMGYAIAAAVETGQPVLAVEGDSAFGFSGMEIETIVRYNLPVVVVIFNNSGIYRGDAPGTPPSPTGLLPARYDKMMEAFGGVGYHVEDTASLEAAVREALEARKPALINAVIDPTAGTESGNITHLNPKSALQKN